MKTTLNIDRVIIYSDENDKYFHAIFRDKLNVIYGKNTAGKSTLIQLLLFTFGINDNKIKLSEILTEKIFIRLDCTIKKGQSLFSYVFIREDETLFIKDDKNKVLRFNGIGSDQSAEHIKLKKYFHNLFDFDLILESNSGFKQAPIETIFLPYYVSQDVGWVYLRKSFSNLNFYKNFKEDFLDYYLGIENVVDREEKRTIEREIIRIQQQIRFFNDIEEDNQEFKVAKVIDETLAGKANQLLNNISEKKNEILELENEYVKVSNQLTFFSQRLSVVSKVKRNHKKQKPGEDHCPTCSQLLPINLETFYSFSQDNNDTNFLQKNLKERIKTIQSNLNSLNKKIDELRNNIQTVFLNFNKYSENEVTLENWINNKASLKLYENLNDQIDHLNKKLSNEKDNLKKYKTEREILVERRKKSEIFKEKYFSNFSELGLSTLQDERFYQLYEISSFPFQGVQLHFAVLSYHFAFNYLLSLTDDIHRLPFILDSVFKEDLDGGSKIKILKFINSNFPKDTQTILSIADDKNINSKIDEYKNEIFKDNANMICIGDGTNQKALLKPYDQSQNDLIEDSFRIMETV